MSDHKSSMERDIPEDSGKQSSATRLVVSQSTANKILRQLKKMKKSLEREIQGDSLIVLCHSSLGRQSRHQNHLKQFLRNWNSHLYPFLILHISSFWDRLIIINNNNNNCR